MSAWQFLGCSCICTVVQQKCSCELHWSRDVVGVCCLGSYWPDQICPESGLYGIGILLVPSLGKAGNDWGKHSVSSAHKSSHFLLFATYTCIQASLSGKDVSVCEGEGVVIASHYGGIYKAIDERLMFNCWRDRTKKGTKFARQLL